MALAVEAIKVPIVVDASGIARVGGTRVTLDTVIESFLTGMTPEEISKAYSLDLGDIFSTLAYYIYYREEVDQYLSARAIEAAELRAIIEKRWNPVGVREKLLARLEAKD
jgi:uncharacterized protein (DUF433 family)